MTHANLIISTSQRDFALLLCMTLSPGSTEGMFDTKVYSADDEEMLTVTHYLSTGDIADQFAAWLPINGEGGNPAAIVYAAGQMGLVTTLEQVKAMLAEAIITDGDWSETLAANNLRIR